MGSLGSVVDVFQNPESGPFLKGIIGMLFAMPFGFSVDFGWMPVIA